MVPVTSILSVVVVMFGLVVLAVPAPEPAAAGVPGSANLGARTGNPFSGVSYEPFFASGCSGSSQGNTNVNEGTTACVNVSNAKSINIDSDLCPEAYIEYFGQLDCGSSVLFTHTLGPQCYAKTDTAVLSMRVHPQGCI